MLLLGWSWLAMAQETCSGSCGTQSQWGSCYCDASCEMYGDCCGDKAALCDVTLDHNDSTCNPDRTVSVLPAESGHWAAARLTPTHFPFDVHTLRYTLVHEPTTSSLCSAEVSHEVMLFTGTGTTPPSSPTVLWQTTVPAASLGSASQLRDMELAVMPPVRVPRGHNLFMAVRMIHDGEPMCLYACGGARYAADRNYWSNAASPAYPWVQLGSFNIRRNYLFRADGQPDFLDRYSCSCSSACSLSGNCCSTCP